ncbi:MAG: SGNH/GDSL hydrolase family protein [Arcticibacter sp.]
MKRVNRRYFLKASALIGTSSFLGSKALATARRSSSAAVLPSRILFQGDSITDGGRSRNHDWNHVMGHGYAFIIAGRLGFEQPAIDYQFFNRGVSGNTVPDLAARWKEDTIDLAPDILSILIGVNDANAEIDGRSDFSASSYASRYRKLITETKSQLPKLKLIIGEPFILPVGRVKESWSKWYDCISARQEAAKDLAAEFNAVYIPYQSHFNAALQKAPADHWIWDGIHPMPAGHELMARQWIETANL